MKTGENSVSSSPLLSPDEEAPAADDSGGAAELEASPGPGERGVRGERGVACVIIAGVPSSAAGARAPPGVCSPPDGDQSILLRLPRMLPRGVAAAVGVASLGAPASPDVPFWRGESIVRSARPLRRRLEEPAPAQSRSALLGLVITAFVLPLGLPPPVFAGQQ